MGGWRDPIVSVSDIQSMMFLSGVSSNFHLESLYFPSQRNCAFIINGKPFAVVWTYLLNKPCWHHLTTGQISQYSLVLLY